MARHKAVVFMPVLGLLMAPTRGLVVQLRNEDEYQRDILEVGHNLSSAWASDMGQVLRPGALEDAMDDVLQDNVWDTEWDLSKCSKYCGGAGRWESRCFPTRCACPACPGPGAFELDRRSQPTHAQLLNDASRINDFIMLANDTSTVEYPFSDILRQRGAQWRVDSVRVLCDSSFRGSLLRQALSSLTTVGGQALDAEDELMEDVVRKAMAEGEQGYSCVAGSSGPSAVRLPTAEDLLGGVAEAVRDRLWRHDCAPPQRHELVVTLRMGDRPPDVQRVVQAVDTQLRGSRKKLITTIIFSGVMRYPTSVVSEDGGSSKTPTSVQENLEAIHNLISIYRMVGYEVRVHSEAAEDARLCYLACAPALVQYNEQFAQVVKMVRDLSCAPEFLLFSSFY